MRHLYICLWAAAAIAGQNDIAALKEQGACDSLSAAYTAAIYGVEPARAGGYQAWNARQELTTRFRSDGVQVESADGSLGLQLVGWGAADVVVSGKRIEYRRGSMVEWYVNEAAGLEQGFTFFQRPAGATPGVPLTIALALRGSWQPEIFDEGRSILFRSGRKAKLRYAGLKAWDARGRDLPARMEIAGEQVRILVDDAGAAYPVTVDPVIQQSELTASDGANGDYFGDSVSVSGDTVVAGSPGSNSHAGAAYVFIRSGTTWTQQAKLTALDAASNDVFGISVSVSGDTLVAGAWGKNSFTGAAYVFVRSGTTWTQQGKLTASDAASGDAFGYSVSVSGDTVVAGAWQKNTHTGAAYVFVRSGTTWTQQAKLNALDAANNDEFGVSVSVSGNTVVVGTPNKDSFTGAGYVFVRSGSTWTQQAKLSASDAAFSDELGVSVSVSGDTAVAGASAKNNLTGAAYVFVRSGTTWTQQAKLNASDGANSDDFGSSVSVSGDTVVAGAPGNNSKTGASYVFVRRGTIWTQQAKLIASDAASNDQFGYSVSISGDTVVAGANWKNSFTGAAYVFVSTATLLFQNDASGAIAAWYLGGPKGDAFEGINYFSNGVAGWSAVALVDLNHDGVPDLIWQNNSTRAVAVWFMGGPQGNSYQSTGWISGDIPGWKVVGIADLNNDGAPDVIWQNDTTLDIWVWYLGGAQGTSFVSANFIAGGIPGWHVVGLADFDGDTHPDLLLQQDSSRAVAIWYLAGPQGNVFQSSASFTPGVPGWRVAGAADINNDSHPDLIWQNDNDRSIYVWYGAGGNLFTSSDIISSGVPGWSVVGVTR